MFSSEVAHRGELKRDVTLESGREKSRRRESQGGSLAAASRPPPPLKWRSERGRQ